MMIIWFFAAFFCAAPLSAQMQAALDPGFFEETEWTNGTEELAFYKRVRYFSVSSRPDILYRYRIRRDGKTYEDGTFALVFGWREEKPYLQDNVPVTNYFYKLTLTPDLKTPRMATVQMVFVGDNPHPVGFIDTSYDILWNRKEPLLP